VADACDRTLVLYGGQIMEEGPTDNVFELCPKVGDGVIRRRF
jgi:ABC-type dipeptide/oligopeptide/nickel transport system ATPase component